MRGELLLKDREKTARRGDAVGAFADQFFGRLQEGGAQALALLVDDDARTCTGHNLIEHRERPRQCIARIAGRARPFRIEHENSHARAIDGLSAVPCSCIHRAISENE